MKYIPQLDSLRAVAVFLVILTHWFGGFWNYGHHGVVIFFVLSGFLITSILLDVSEKSSDKLKSLKHFAIRRALRIFPIYYLFILFFLILGMPFMNQNFVWFATYTSNILYFKLGEFPESLFSHLWSLAVEEQFYLFWPLLLLFLPQKKHLGLLLLIVLIGILSRIFILNYGLEIFGSNFNYTLTTTYFDTLALGGILGYLLQKRKLIPSVRIGKIALLSFVVNMSLYVYLSNSDWISSIKTVSLTFFSISICSFILVLICKQDNKYWNFIFKQKTLIFIGKISYGLYLYHKVIPWLVSTVLRKINIAILNKFALNTLYFVVLFVICIVSYYLIEKPVNGKKAYFKYY